MAFALIASGCASDAGFGQVLVEPLCADWDQWCRGQSLATRIAEGARLEVRVGSRTTLTSSDGVTLRSSDPAIFTVEERTVVGQGPGTAVLLFYADDRLLDFTHVTIDEVTGMALYREGAEEPEEVASLALVAGETARIRAVPTGPSGPLLGDLPTEFVPDDPDGAVDVSETERAIERALEGQAPGTAELRAAQGAFTQMLTILVGETP